MSVKIAVAVALSWANLATADTGSSTSPWPELSQLTTALRSANVVERRTAVVELEPFADGDVQPLWRAALRDGDGSVRREAVFGLARRRLLTADELRALLVDGDAAIRAAAATALSTIISDDTSAVAAALERSLSDADPTVRRAAVGTLAARRDLTTQAPATQAPAAIASAIIGRLDDAEPEVRRAAATALGQLHIAGAVIPLIGRVGDGSRLVRMAAATALAELGDERAQSAVLRLLADPADDVRVAAARALGTLGGAAAVPALSELMHSHTASESLRAHAAFALARLVARTKDTAALEALGQALADPWLSSLAYEALRAAGDAVVPFAVAQLDGADSDEVAARWARLLGATGDARAVSALVREVERARVPPATLAAALASLSAAVADAPLTPTLQSWLRSDNAQLRADAATALLRWCGTRCVETWLTLSSDSVARVRATAVEGLALGPADKTYARLSAMAAAADPSAPAAVSALGRLGDRRATPALLAALVDGRLRVRQRAVVALSGLADRALAPELIHRLRTLPPGDDRLVENIRLLGLVERGQNDAVARDLLLALAERPSTLPAYEAIDALATMGAPGNVRAVEDTGNRSAVARLRALLRSNDPVLRLRTVAALGALTTAGDRDAVARLVAARLDSDPDVHVRAEAAWALGVLGTGADALARARSGDAAVRVNVAAALATLGRGDLLAPLLRDADATVRANAARRPTPPGTTFLAADLLDGDAPLADHTLRLRLPNGLYKSAFVDGRGSLRQERIAAGDAAVELDAR